MAYLQVLCQQYDILNIANKIIYLRLINIDKLDLK